MSFDAPPTQALDPEKAVLLLQEELAETNREVVALALELEKRVEMRTAELRTAQAELRQTNAGLLQLTLELEKRVEMRTHELAESNVALRQEIAERKQAQSEAQAQVGRLQLLSKITRSIGDRQEMQSIFDVIVRSLVGQMPVDFCCICLYEQTADALTVASLAGASEMLAAELGFAERTRVPLDETILLRCIHGEFVYEPELRQLSSPLAQRLVRNGCRSLAAVPLIVDEKVFGLMISVRWLPQGFAAGECEFLLQLGEHVSLATNNAQLYHSLQRAYDDLRRTQQVVMLSEGLSALGQMASGIADDINNALAPAAVYTESLLNHEPNLSERARDYLQTIRQAIEHVAQTLDRMRAFDREVNRNPQLLP
jgi:C4-dicarboxylate-specific signal transduction histidine kinase